MNVESLIYFILPSCSRILILFKTEWTKEETRWVENSTGDILKTLLATRDIPLEAEDPVLKGF